MIELEEIKTELDNYIDESASCPEFPKINNAFGRSFIHSKVWTKLNEILKDYNIKDFTIKCDMGNNPVSVIENNVIHIGIDIIDYENNKHWYERNIKL